MPVSPSSSFSLQTQRVFDSIREGFPRGTIFFAEDLSVPGLTPQYIRLALSELSRDSVSIIRLSRGVYCFPLHDAACGVVVPDPLTVAESLAARWHVRIAPCGAQAAYLAGLVPWPASTPLRFVSDGSEQYFNLEGGRRIEFVRRKSNKVFDFRDERLRNLVEGLRWLGPDGVGEPELAVAWKTLREVSRDDLHHDMRLAPGWISAILRDLESRQEAIG